MQGTRRLSSFLSLMVQEFIYEFVPRQPPSTREQAHRGLDKAPPDRQLMNSHAHVILELPAPRERDEEADEAFEDLNTLTCRVRVVFNVF